MRKLIVGTAALAFAIAGTSGCATKGFVTSEVGKVNGKVDTVSQALEQTQERTRQNEENITKVDGKATAAQGTADQALRAAGTADGKATEAGATASANSAKIDAMAKDARRITATVILTEDQGGFKSGKWELPDETKAKVDEMVAGLMADPKNAFFEIEGYTDNTGSKMTNAALGLARADAVKRYLYEQHQIPLHRINIISFGPENPVADNATKEGRAQNRRVVIKVLN